MSEVVDTLEFGALSNFNVGQHRNVTPKKLKDKKVKKLIVVFVLQVQGEGKRPQTPLAAPSEPVTKKNSGSSSRQWRAQPS